MELKKALNVSQQLALLKDRGLDVEEVELAETFLKNNNYYRLNYYFKKCRDGTEIFTSIRHFEEIIDIYEFDKWTRISLLSVLEPIEIKIRSNIAYFLAMKYGSGCFYEKEHFEEFYYSKVEKAFASEIEQNKDLKCVIHHQKNYEGKFPIWVIVELLTFGQISKLYSALLIEDKNQLADDLYKLDSKYLKSWLLSLSFLRNQCAHYAPLYKKEYVFPPLIGNLFHWNSKENNNLFSMLLAIKRLSESERWEIFIQQFSDFQEKQNSVDLSDYGFPKEWKRYLF